MNKEKELNKGRIKEKKLKYLLKMRTFKENTQQGFMS